MRGGYAEEERRETEIERENLRYRYVPLNDVPVNDGPHIRRWFHNIIILYYNTYHCVTVAYSIQHS